MAQTPDPSSAGSARTQDIGAVLTGTAATASQNTPDFVGGAQRGVKVVFDVTNAGTGSVTLTIQGKDPASGKYYTLLAGVAVVANGTAVYTVYPGITAAANVSASDVLPKVWRILVTANNANPVTYTVGACLVP